MDIDELYKNRFSVEYVKVSFSAEIFNNFIDGFLMKQGLLIFLLNCFRLNDIN
jgi:hypothetical protein